MQFALANYGLKLTAGPRSLGRSLAALRVAPIAATVLLSSGYLRPGRSVSLIR